MASDAQVQAPALAQAPSRSQDQPQSQPLANTGSSEGSKFKRFLRKFGRKPSDEGVPTSSPDKAATDFSDAPSSPPTGQSATTLDQRSRRGSKPKGSGLLTKNKNSNTGSLNGNGASTRNRGQSVGQAPPSSQGRRKTRESMTFGGNSGQGLADTLVMPSAGQGLPAGTNASASASPPPQLQGLPTHDPINPVDLAADGSRSETQSTPLIGGTGAIPVDGTLPKAAHDQTADQGIGSTAAVDGAAPALAAPLPSASEADGGLGLASAAPQPQPLDQPDSMAANGTLSESSSSPAQSRAGTSFDFGSTDGFRGRDSTDNRTTDTGKSTKPTTLMSLETREQSGSNGLAHIAQYRHGEQPASASSASPAATRGAGTGSSSIQFGPAPVAHRTTTGTVNLPGYGEPAENSPYTNVPAISRPHPSNNPTPSGVPPDNASMLTLASSTAAQSIGGAASSRGHYHAPSLGGARSIGGSLMGERRNSADTSASLMAIPPTSRRGSDESTRTGWESVAASATGLNSAQAMTASASTTNVAGPGAPPDRVSMQRTSSQRTVATQLSIPLSTSASNAGLLGERRPSFGSGNLLSANSHQAGAAASPSNAVAGGQEEPASAPANGEATVIGAEGASKDAEPQSGGAPSSVEGEGKSGPSGTSLAATAAASAAVQSHVERVAAQEEDAPAATA